MAISAPDLTASAKKSADKITDQLNDAFGHAGNGLVTLYEDPAVPQHQKINLFTALGDRLSQGVLATVATLTGQPDARLALSGGTSTPDPITAPAPAPTAGPTPADVEKQALKARLKDIEQYITSNGGTLVENDPIAGINSVVAKKETAAKAAATAAAPTASAADSVSKAAVKAEIDKIAAVVSTFSESKVPGIKDQHTSAENFDKLNKAAVALTKLVS